MRTLRPLDFLLLIIILSFSVFLMKNNFSSKARIAHVQAGGQSYQYSLENDGLYKVQGPLGWTEIEIKDHKIRIIDSPCPNKTCVSKGWTNPIVCLPNKVIITLENSGGFDAVAE